MNSSIDNHPTNQQTRQVLSYGDNPIKEASERFGITYAQQFLPAHSLRDRERIVPTIEKAVAAQPYEPLAAICKEYGNEALEWWIKINLIEVLNFCGVFQGVTIYQVMQTARLIAAEYPWLTTYELMHFFLRFEAGKYQRFYQQSTVNMQVIMQSLDAYAREVQQARALTRQQPAIDYSDAISWEEYCRRHGKDITNNPLKRTS